MADGFFFLFLAVAVAVASASICGENMGFGNHVHTPGHEVGKLA